MPAQYALCRDPDLEFLDVVARLVVPCRNIVYGERHSQVAAQHVDDGLPVLRVALREALQSVQTRQPDHGLIAAQLVGGLGVQVGDPPLDSVRVGRRLRVGLLCEVELSAPLPACGEVQGEHPAAADTHAQPDLQCVELRGSAVLAR